MAATQSAFEFPPQPPAANPAPIVHTGNAEFAGATISSGRYGSPLVPIVLDTTLPDHLWMLFVGDRPVGPAHRITLNVGEEIRKAIERHRGRTQCNKP